MKTFKSILLNMIKDPRENTNQWMNSIPALERKASNMDTKVNNVEEKIQQGKLYLKENQAEIL